MKIGIIVGSVRDEQVGASVGEWVLRHAQAKRSWIRLWRGDDALHLEIRDDGLCPGRVVEGHGLQGMRERLHRLGGELQIDLSGQALRLQARIPTAEPAA